MIGVVRCRVWTLAENSFGWEIDYKPGVDVNFPSRVFINVHLPKAEKADGGIDIGGNLCFLPVFLFDLPWRSAFATATTIGCISFLSDFHHS